jgi:nitrogen fixation/metabolism regulation signal transduction histidine kinase
MKLRNRLFLAFFLFAFLPVAVISFISLELALNSLDRVASPGIEKALADADSLVELSLSDLESRCFEQMAMIDLESPRDDGCGFDLIVVRKYRTTAVVFDRVADSSLSSGAVEFVETMDSTDTTGWVSIGDKVLVYGVRSVGDTTVLAGFVLRGGYASLLDDFGLNQHRFGQLGLLKTSGKKFMRFIWAAATLSYLLMIILVTRVTARGLTRPLSRLGDLVEEVGPGNWDVHLDYNRKDEIGSLVSGFNRMSSRLSETTLRMIEAEKTAAWQQTARVIAHGIKNALAPVKLAIARLSKTIDTQDSGVMSPLGTIHAELELLEKTARDFSMYGRPVEGRPTDVNLNMVARQAARMCEADCGKVTVEFSPDENLPTIVADENMLREALINLIKNACEAVDDGGHVTIRTSIVAEGVSVAISDDGAGIDPEIKEKLFEPYATTKPNGTGLGLAIVKKIVISSGGKITFETGNEGTTFTLLLPSGDEGKSS